MESKNLIRLKKHYMLYKSSVENNFDLHNDIMSFSENIKFMSDIQSSGSVTKRYNVCPLRKGGSDTRLTILWCFETNAGTLSVTQGSRNDPTTLMILPINLADSVTHITTSVITGLSLHARHLRWLIATLEQDDILTWEDMGLPEPNVILDHLNYMASFKQFVRSLVREEA